MMSVADLFVENTIYRGSPIRGVSGAKPSPPVNPLGTASEWICFVVSAFCCCVQVLKHINRSQRYKTILPLNKFYLSDVGASKVRNELRVVP